MKKVCRQCGTEQRRADFYRHPQMADGTLNVCKSCIRANVRANYRRNIAHYKEYEKERSMLPHRVKARNEYRKTPQGKAAVARSNHKYAGRYPLKSIAHAAVSNAVRDGKLKKQPCEVCGNQVAQAHHDDYTKPLEVRWLCEKHHAEWHKHNKAFYPPQEKKAA